MQTRAAIDLFMGAFALVFMLHQLEPPQPVDPPPKVAILVTVDGQPSDRPCAVGIEFRDDHGELQRNYESKIPFGKVEANETTCETRWVQPFEVSAWSEVEFRIIPIVMHEGVRVSPVAARLTVGDEREESFSLGTVPKCLPRGARCA